MKYLTAVILVILCAFAVAGARRSDPLGDCLSEARDNRDIGMDYCILAWNTQGQIQACLGGVSDRYFSESTQCHVMYDTMEVR